MCACAGFRCLPPNNLSTDLFFYRAAGLWVRLFRHWVRPLEATTQGGVVPRSITQHLRRSAELSIVEKASL